VTFWMRTLSDKDTLSNLNFPHRLDESVYYYNDSGIKGADEYAKFELRKARENTSYDFCMVLKSSLPKGVTIENYAAALFQDWDIGRQYGGKGILFLFVEDIKELKIEVSYELEDIYPDVYCSSFQQQVKSYMSGHYYGDVFSTLVNAMIFKNGKEDTIVSKQYALKRGGMSEGFLSGGAGVTTKDFYADIQERVALAIDYDHDSVTAKYPAGDTPLITLRNYLRSLQDGVDYPFLPFLTKGSQMMRLEYPHPSSQLKAMWRDEYNSATPVHIMEDGEFAAVNFSGNNTHIYLRKSKSGKWLVDVVKTWAFQGKSLKSGLWWLGVREQPWMFASRNEGYRNSGYQLKTLRPVDEDPYERLAYLREQVRLNPNEANAYFELGEYLYYECYWIRAAITTIEEGLIFDPGNIEKRFMVLAMRYKFPMWDKIAEHYEAILEFSPKSWRAWSAYIRFAEVYLDDKDLSVQLKSRSPYHK